MLVVYMGTVVFPIFSGTIVSFCCWIICKEASDSCCDELMALNKNFENTSRYYKAVTSRPIQLYVEGKKSRLICKQERYLNFFKNGADVHCIRVPLNNT